jgi:hypothetical protein
MHRVHLCPVSRVWLPCMSLTRHSPDIPYPSTSFLEHGLTEEEIHIMCQHSRRNSSNVIHEDAHCRDTNFWYPYGTISSDSI